MRIFLFLLCISFTIHAQEFKFGKVSKKELEQTQHPLDTAAIASTLYKSGNLYMTYDNRWKYRLEVIERIKIYQKEGFEFATINIPYYISNNNDYNENVMKVKASVYNLQNGNVVAQKVKKNDILDKNLTENWNALSFAFPNVKEGSILEYTYTIESPNVRELPDWDFQDEIPVDYSEYKMVVPSMFFYNSFQKGYHPIEKTKRVTTTSLAISENDSPFKSTNASGTTNAIEYKYCAKDIPKLKDEPFVSTNKCRL